MGLIFDILTQLQITIATYLTGSEFKTDLILPVFFLKLSYSDTYQYVRIDVCQQAAFAITPNTPMAVAADDEDI